MKDLHAEIMNLPCKHVQTNDPCVELTYQMGHRDARHAAAELVVAAAPESPCLVTALAEIRDLFPMPEPGGYGENEWLAACGYPKAVPEYVRTMIAAPDREPVGWELVVKLLVASGNIEQSKVDEACEIAAALPQAQPAADLTDAEICALWQAMPLTKSIDYLMLQFAKTVLAAQRGKS